MAASFFRLLKPESGCISHLSEQSLRGHPCLHSSQSDPFKTGHGSPLSQLCGPQLTQNHPQTSLCSTGPYGRGSVCFSPGEGCRLFIIWGQIVKILGFVGHTWSFSQIVFLWPFKNKEHFLPWRLSLVPAISLRFPSLLLPCWSCCS